MLERVQSIQNRLPNNLNSYPWLKKYVEGLNPSSSAKITAYKAVQTGEEQPDRYSIPPYEIKEVTNPSEFNRLFKTVTKIRYIYFKNHDSDWYWNFLRYKNPYPNIRDRVKGCCLYLLFHWRWLIQPGFPYHRHVPKVFFTIEGINDFVFYLD